MALNESAKMTDEPPGPVPPNKRIIILLQVRALITVLSFLQKGSLIFKRREAEHLTAEKVARDRVFRFSAEQTFRASKEVGNFAHGYGNDYPGETEIITGRFPVRRRSAKGRGGLFSVPDATYSWRQWKFSALTLKYTCLFGFVSIQ